MAFQIVDPNIIPLKIWLQFNNKENLWSGFIYLWLVEQKCKYVKVSRLPQTILTGHGISTNCTHNSFQSFQLGRASGGAGGWWSVVYAVNFLLAFMSRLLVRDLRDVLSIQILPQQNQLKCIRYLKKCVIKGRSYLLYGALYVLEFLNWNDTSVLEKWINSPSVAWLQAHDVSRRFEIC